MMPSLSTKSPWAAEDRETFPYIYEITFTYRLLLSVHSTTTHLNIEGSTGFIESNNNRSLLGLAVRSHTTFA